MTTDYLTLEVEDYSSRPQVDDQASSSAENATNPDQERTGVSIPALVMLTVFFAGFVALAVALGQIAGAC
jgi:hypothetical protein